MQEAFGDGLRELLLRSLTVRVSAAEPAEVPMGNVLPYVSMILDSYEQLAGGMHEVVAAAAERSRVHLHTEARGLLVEDGRVRGLRLADTGGGSGSSGAGETGEASGPGGVSGPGEAGEANGSSGAGANERVERFDGVVLAAHAHASARLLAPTAPRLAALLEEVRYFPVTVLLAEYERPVFDARVRATVFGAQEPLSNAGAYGLEDLNVVRFTFSGRRARELGEGEPDPELLAEIAERTLAPYARVTGNRRRALLARRFSPGLCAYHPEQAALLRGVAASALELPGLALTGDYLRGCSIEACFRAAEERVAAIG